MKATNKEKELCWNDNFTIKAYLILKQLIWKEEALESLKTAPINVR